MHMHGFQAEMQRRLAQEILRISLFIYYKNVHFAQEISWKMSKNFSLALKYFSRYIFMKNHTYKVMPTSKNQTLQEFNFCKYYMF